MAITSPLTAHDSTVPKGEGSDKGVSAALPVPVSLKVTSGIVGSAIRLAEITAAIAAFSAGGWPHQIFVRIVAGIAFFYLLFIWL